MLTNDQLADLARPEGRTSSAIACPEELGGQAAFGDGGVVRLRGDQSRYRHAEHGTLARRRHVVPWGCRSRRHK